MITRSSGLRLSWWERLIDSSLNLQLYSGRLKMNLGRFWIFTILLFAIPAVHSLALEGHTKRGELTLPRIVAESGEKTNLVAELSSGDKSEFCIRCPDSTKIECWKHIHISGEPPILVSGCENATKVSLQSFLSTSSGMPRTVSCVLIKGSLPVDSRLNIQSSGLGGEWDGKKEGAIHRLMGKVKLFDYEFDSDPKDPLTFKMTSEGYRYLRGSGIVTDATTGKTFELPPSGRMADKKDDVGTGTIPKRRSPPPTEQAQSLQTALKDPDPNARYEAVRKLNNQKFLAQAAETDPDRHVRWAAVDRLKDQPSLSRVALNDPDQLVRLRAVHRLTDLEFLRAVAKKSSDQKVAQQARDETDKIARERQAPPSEAKSAENALKSVDPDVRYKAVEKLTDEKRLARIAKSDPSHHVRWAAVERLRIDQATLAQIALHDPDELVRLRAVHRLNDRTLLQEVAKKSSDESVAKQAREKITDEKRSGGEEKRKEEPAKQPDKKKRSKPSLEDPDPDVRLRAVQALTDQNVLARVAKNDSSHFVRWAAVDRLTDQDALAEVASKDPNEMVRLRAVNRLTDPKALGAAAKGARDKGTIKALLGKLSDTDMLISFAQERTNRMLSRAAALRLLELAGMNPSTTSTHKEKAVDLRLAVLDPVITRHYGQLLVEYAYRVTGRSYGFGTMPFGSVWREHVTIRIKDRRGNLITKQEFSGAPFPKTIRVRLVPGGGQRNVALVDIHEVCKDVLKRMGRAKVELAAKSEDRYVSGASKSLLEAGYFDRKTPVQEIPDDQKELVKMVMSSRDADLRWKAVQKLTIQKVLTRIAKEDSDRHVRWAAVDKLNDQEALASIAMRDSDELIRLRAVHRLSDPKLLEKLSANTPRPKVALAALNKRWELAREKPKSKKRITRRQRTPEKIHSAGNAVNVPAAGREEKSRWGDYVMGIAVSSSRLNEIERNLISEVERRSQDAGEFSSTGVVFAQCKCRDHRRMAYGYSTAFTYSKEMTGFAMELAKELTEYAKRNSCGCTTVTSRVIE